MSKPVRITQQVVERNVQQQRILDVARRELGTFAEENAKLLSSANSISKIENKRQQAERRACETELKFENDMKEEEKQKRYQGRLLAQNQVIATELDREVAEEERRAREIQRICEQAPELKELEKQLKTAYLSKERTAQLQERVLLETLEKERIQAIEDKMEYDRQMALKSEGDKDGEKRRIYEDQRNVLLRQIAEKEEALAEAQRMTEKDKATVDEIVKRINYEDEMEMRKRMEQKEASRQMIKDYEEQRKREVAAKRAAEKAEEDAINAYNRSVAERGAGVAAKKQAKKEEEDRKLAIIVAEAERKRKAEEEFNNLRDMLWEEELEAQRAADARARAEKQHRMKMEMMDANDRMMIQKAEIKKVEADKEAKLLDIMRRKFAEDERLEKEKESDKLNAKKHHMTLVEKQRLERRQMYEQERKEEAIANQEAAKKENYRLQVVAEARKRLLQEHASKLQGFLPRGTLKDKDELNTYFSN